MQTFSPFITYKVSDTDNHPLKIIALGDSIVYGFGDPLGGGWVERLRRYWMSLDSQDHVLYNLGIRGDRVTQVHERLEMEFRHRGELRNRYPDMIIISVGINDSPRLVRPNGREFTEISLFKQQMANLLDEAKRLCPVAFVGMIPVNENKMPFHKCLYYNHADQYRYKEVTKKACQDRHIPYLDIFDLWMGRGEKWCNANIGGDGLHPNIGGYQALLQDVLSWEPIAKLTKPNDNLNYLL